MVVSFAAMPPEGQIAAVLLLVSAVAMVVSAASGVAPGLRTPSAVLGISLVGAALGSTDLSGRFSWHPICMTSATMVLIPSAAEMIRKRNSAELKLRGRFGLAHGVLMSLALTLAIVGVAAIYNNKPAGFPGVHFGTLHALAGLAAMGGMVSAASSAMARSAQTGQWLLPKWTGALHRKLGQSADVLCCVAVVTGLYNRVPLVDWALLQAKAIPSDWWKPAGWSLNTFGAWPTAVWVVLALAALVTTARPKPRLKTP